PLKNCPTNNLIGTWSPGPAWNFSGSIQKSCARLATGRVASARNAYSPRAFPLNCRRKKMEVVLCMASIRSLQRSGKHNMRVALAALLLVGGWLALPAVSLAHEIRPALITITFADEAHYNIELSVNLEALLAGVSPAHKDANESPNAQRYNDLRALPPEKLRTQVDAFMPQL